MPELPEVETVRKGLEPAMTGKKLADIKVHRADLRVPFPADLERLKGKTVSRLARRAKYLLIHFKDDILVIHLGMSGQMIVEHDMKSYELKKHDHMVITMTGGTGVVFNDPRRFGMAILVKEEDLAEHPSFKALGPEPLSNSFNGPVLHDTIKAKNTPVKSALLDQRVVAGIGNIYACEALFEARIDPRKKASVLTAVKCEDLAKALKSVLTRAIAAGGSSLKDYRQADGSLGYFQHSFLVYDKEGEACPRCPANGKKKHTIHRITQAGRSTFYCPGCQK
jgi:formamidopyrimidine-DNA glycosylase